MGDHKIASFFVRRKSSTVPAGIDMVVSDVSGNILLAKGFAMDSAVTILGGGGCKDGGYYIITDHVDLSYRKFQVMMTKLDSSGLIQWNSAVEYVGNDFNKRVTLLEDEYGNFYYNLDGYHSRSMLTSLYANGTYRWSTSFAYDTIYGGLNAMCLTKDSGIMCISSSYNNKVLTVVNYDGSVRWSKNFVTDSNEVSYHFIRKTPDGGYIAGGTYNFLTHVGPYNPPGSGLCKFDRNGVVQWETYFYKNSRCALVGAIDAVQNWDGQYSVISLDYGIQNMIFDHNGNYVAYLKKFPTHTHGQLYPINNHVVMVTYPEVFQNILGPHDTMQYSYFESDHVLDICGASTDIGIGRISVTDSNNRVIINGHRVYPANATVYAPWPVNPVNVTYTGAAIVECTPPLLHNDTAAISIDSTTLGISQVHSTKLSIYPNPSTGKLSISVDNSARAIGTLELSDITGKILLSDEIENNTMELDLSEYTNGIYILRTENSKDNDCSISKIILQR
ncbi:MAG: T9SS type A sorting domain-containing protein [Bacteroidetes bacterium]|nr:T9SS type A sorting domain-containing protein [Bacteroidota bacterium]